MTYVQDGYRATPQTFLVNLILKRSDKTHLYSPMLELHLCRVPGCSSPKHCHFDVPLTPLQRLHHAALHSAALQQNLSESSSPSWTGQLRKKEIKVMETCNILTTSTTVEKVITHYKIPTIKIKIKST